MQRRTEGPENARASVLHALGTHDATALASGVPATSCAVCGSPLPEGRRGVPRPGARFCSAGCRFADVRARRAAARTDLLAALGQLAEVTRRVENALRVLGLNPVRPRRKKEHPCPTKP